MKTMNTVERYTAAFKGEPVDRIPIAAWIGMPLLEKRCWARAFRPFCVNTSKTQ